MVITCFCVGFRPKCRLSSPRWCTSNTNSVIRHFWWHRHLYLSLSALGPTGTTIWWAVPQGAGAALKNARRVVGLKRSKEAAGFWAKQKFLFFFL